MKNEYLPSSHFVACSYLSRFTSMPLYLEEYLESTSLAVRGRYHDQKNCSPSHLLTPVTTCSKSTIVLKVSLPSLRETGDTRLR